MLPATKSEPRMLSRPKKCSRVYMQPGVTIKTVRKCDSQILEVIIHPKTSILWRIIQQCQGGSKAWKLSFGNMVYGHKGMNAQCNSFKCVAGKTNCCCRQLLLLKNPVHITLASKFAWLIQYQEKLYESKFSF